MIELLKLISVPRFPDDDDDGGGDGDDDDDDDGDDGDDDDGGDDGASKLSHLRSSSSREACRDHDADTETPP